MYIEILILYPGVLLYFLIFLSFCSYSILDPEIFSLNNCGTIVVREAVENSIKPTPSVIIESGMTKEQIGKNF